MRKIWFVLVLLLIQWTFTINPDCIASTDHDLAAIKNLFLTFEEGYEQGDIEKYISVFSPEQYEYISDMSTPDDPSDDVRFSSIDDERRSAVKVFERFKNLDLEISDQEFIINSNLAIVKNQTKIVFIVFEDSKFPHVSYPKAGFPNIFYPEVYYAAVNNTFRLGKFNGQWKIVRWQQNELSSEELAAWSEREAKGKSIDDMIEELAHPSMVKWAIAISDLRKIRDVAMNSLIKALSNSDKNLKIHAAWVLAGTRNERAIKELIKILRNKSEDVDVRVAVANVLSQCGSYEVGEDLLKVAKTARSRVKAAALLALARHNKREAYEIYEVAAAGISHEEVVVREAAVESIGIIRSFQRNDELEKRFGYKNESEEVRLTALESLKENSPESASHLFVEALEDKDESVNIRSAAARALGETKDVRFQKLLMDMAKNKKESVELRRAAIAGLGIMGSPKATKFLIDFLDSPDSVIRYEAVKSLELLADSHALKPLMMMLMNRDEKDWIRILAGRGAVKIDKDIAFGPLTQILKDKTESAPARRMAAEEIVSSGNAHSILVFSDVLRDKQQPWWLRKIAVNCIVQLESCNSPSSPCADALKVAINDPDERVANAAREALAVKPGLLSKNQ